MDLSPTIVAAPGAAELPRLIPDQRPTADTAALSRNPRPELPLGVPATAPPSPGQAAAVARSQVAGAEGANPARPVERVLKPFGVAMLPSEARAHGQAADRPEDASDTEADTTTAPEPDTDEDPDPAPA